MLERIGKYTNNWPLWAQVLLLVGVAALGTGMLTFLATSSVGKAGLAVGVVTVLVGSLFFFYYFKNGGLPRDRARATKKATGGPSQERL